jgi:hypothetical protein
VLGAVLVINDDSNTTTMVEEATLGGQLIESPPGTGGPLNIENYEGYDTYYMKLSNLPWGLYINNDTDGDEESRGTWGSQTDIIESFIGTRLATGTPTVDPSWFPQSIAMPAGVAFYFQGDDGKDVMNINDTVFGAAVNIYLYDGNLQTITIQNTSSMPALYIRTGNGRDTVLIDNSTVSTFVDIFLYDGDDVMKLSNMNLFTQWPDTITGFVDVDGGIGVDTLETLNVTGTPVNFVDF